MAGVKSYWTGQLLYDKRVWVNITRQILKIPEEEKTPAVTQLLELINISIEENQGLKDEISRLKGQKPRPIIRPSNLTKEETNKGDRRLTGGKNRRPKI